MAWDPITTAEIQPNKPVIGDGGFGSKVKNNLDYLYGNISAAGGGGIPNGSFEIDSDSDGIPDKWTRSLYPGGSGAFETTNPVHGAKAYKFTHPGGAGNGGGYLESDYVEVTSLYISALGYILWSSVAGIKNIVRVSYYTSAKVIISSTDLYNSISNPTSPTRYLTQFTPPSTARYMKVILIAGYTDTNVAGTTYFDDISLFEGVYTDRIMDAAISQAKLKTSQGTVSTSSAANLVLPGGEYGFYPRFKGSDGSSFLSVHIMDYYVPSQYSYETIIYLIPNSGMFYAQQRYVTSSGTEHWVFILYDKTNDKIISAYEAPDHPCFGNGDDVNVVPHPFADHRNKPLPADYEIILLDIDSTNELKKRATKKKGILEMLHNGDYEIDMNNVKLFKPRDMDGRKILKELPSGIFVRSIL